MKSLAATTPPTPLEADFQLQITQLAHLLGWEDFHVRAGRTKDSWRTPGSGTMARGWPDLVLVRGKRLLFVEVKRDGGKLTADQERVLGVLDGTSAEVYCWRPADWDQLEKVLR